MDAARKLPKAIILFPVFIPAVVITLLLVIGTASNPELAGELFDSVLAYITRTFGWFYMLSVAFLHAVGGVLPGVHRRHRPDQMGQHQAGP